LPGTNTLAYEKKSEITAVKCFIRLAPVFLKFYFHRCLIISTVGDLQFFLGSPHSKTVNFGDFVENYGARTLSIMTLSKMTFCITTLGITKLRMMTFSISTLNIMTFSIKKHFA
jgi:hypothetical protein